MPKIFISYRREDAGGHAGRLCDRLNARLGSEGVFMDVEDVRPGEDFVRAIGDTLAACEYLLVVIGPRWLDALNSRPSSNTDFVRQEIRWGLERGTKVIPVLVAGASMPAASELPADLAELTRRNAVQLRDDRFDDDVSRLLDLFGSTTPAPGPARRGRRAWVAAAAAAVAAAAFGAWWFVPRPSPVTLSGEWLAEMRKPPQPVFRIGLTLVQTGSVVAGIVRYPTGDGVIQDGRIEGDAVTFSTSHVPQFASEPATIRFVGTVEPDGIHLTSTDDGGVATGIARRAGPAP